MRQMAGDRQHQIMMIGRHDLDPGAHAGPECTQGFDGHRIGAVGRREDAPAVDEEFGEAEEGPECSVPATGWAGRNERSPADAAPSRGRWRP